MPSRLIQPAFSSGELSPNIYSRVDIAKYSTGLRKLKNFLVHPSGGASNRPGWRFKNAAKYSDRDCIVQEFIFSQQQKYTFEIGDNYMRFYTQGARISVDEGEVLSWNSGTAYVPGDYVEYNDVIYFSIQAGTNQQPDTQTAYWTAQTVYEVVTPWGEEDLEQLRFESSADTIFISHPDFQTRILSRFANADWRMTLYEPEDGPFMPENIDETISMSVSAVSGDTVTLSATAAVFSELHIGALWKLRHYIEGQVVSDSASGAEDSSSIRCFTTWRLITHGTWTGKVTVQKSTDNGSTWTNLRTFSSANDQNINTSGTESIEDNPVPFLVRVRVTDMGSGTVNYDLTTDPFFQEGIVKILSIDSDQQAQARVLQQVGATTATIDWAEGSWSNFRGWPAVARFYQDRLCHAGTYGEPMTMWLTETGNYFSFRRHQTLLDTDAITARLPSRQLNAINGLVAFKRLLVLTSASVWSVGPVSGSTMTPTGFTQEVEVYNGSNGINPVVIGNEAIYVQEHGKFLSNIGFEEANQSFVGNQLNVLSMHLFDRWNIVDIAYQRNPDNIVYCLRDDGTMVGMTYLREQEVIAFHQHSTEGFIKSHCVIPAENFDEMWAVIERENGIFIETQTLRMQGVSCGGENIITAENQVFLDSCVELNNPVDLEDIEVDEDGNIIVESVGNGLSEGDIVFIDCVEGMTEVNGRRFQVQTIQGGANGNLQQVIMASTGSTDFIEEGPTGTFYHALYGQDDNDSWKTEITYANSIFTKAGVLKKLSVRASAFGGEEHTFTIMKNGVATTLTVNIDAGSDNNTEQDLIHEVTVSPGDLISLRCVTNEESGVQVCFALTFESSDSKSSNHAAGGKIAGSFEDEGMTFASVSAPSPTDPSFCVPTGPTQWLEDEERFIVVPTAGKIKNFYIVNDLAPGGGAKAFTYTIRKNGSDTALAVTISALNLSGNNTSDEVSVVAGDLISVKAMPANAPSQYVGTKNIGFTFEATTNGEFPIFAYSGETGTPENSWRTVYGANILFQDSGVDLDPYFFQEFFNSCTITRIQVRLSAAPGTGNSKVYRLTKNTVHDGGINQVPEDFEDTEIVLTLAGAAATTGSATGSVAYADLDRAATKTTFVSSPASAFESISYLATNPLTEGVDPDRFVLVDIGGDPIDGTGYASYIAGGHFRKGESDVSALSHLEGQEVGILADGEVLERQTVVDGQITLATPASIVIVGLPYQSDFETLNIEVPMGDGTLQGRPVRIGNVTFRILNSRGGKLGPDEDNLYDAFEEYDLTMAAAIAPPTGYEDRPKLYSVDVRQPLGGDYEIGGRVFYRQDDPLPITILAVMPELMVSPAGAAMPRR